VWIQTYSGADGSKEFPEFSLLVISSCMQFWSVSVIPKHLDLAAFPKHLLVARRPLASIAVNKPYMFFFVLFVFLSNKLMSSVWPRSQCIPFSHSLSLCAWTFVHVTEIRVGNMLHVTYSWQVMLPTLL
jgi:hypothetical protein